MDAEVYEIRRLQGCPEWYCIEEAERAREPPELPQNPFLQFSESNYCFPQIKTNTAHSKDKSQ